MNAWEKVTHIVISVAVLAAIVAVVMLLWNALIPSIIGWSAINYWEAAGLMILAHLLLGGFGHHFMSFPWHMMREHDRFHERMDRMSWDEKREFIRKRMSRFNQEEE